MPTTFYVSELILTQFRPFDIKYKKLNLAPEFFIFPLGCIRSWGCPLIPFRILVDHVAIFGSSPRQNLRWSTLSQKIGHSWKFFLIVVIESYLNVTGLVDLTLKHIDKLRLR